MRRPPLSLKDIVLRIEPQGRAPFEHQMSGDELIIGRSSSCGLVIPDPYLSRKQARLYRGPEGWFVEDMGGRNPTLLNGLPVTKPVALAVGDMLRMSETTLRVTVPGQPTPETPTTTSSDSGSLFKSAAAIAARAVRDDVATDPFLRRMTDRLRLLNDVHRLLAGPVTLDEVMKLVLDRVFSELIPEEAVIFLKDARGEYYRAATRRLPNVSGDFLYSRHLIREVTEKQLAALVTDTSRDERFANAQSIVLSGVRSLIAAPLLDTEGCPGMIVLSSRANIRQFSEDDMELLVSLASIAALRIRNINLAEHLGHRRALEKEIEIARGIQVALLPERLPQLRGYELAGFNAPSRAVSGDLYKAETRNDGRECVMLLADVSGKGMAAALLTASLEALSVGPIEVGLPPDDICTKLSRRLHARTSPERYATAVVAVIDIETHSLRWSNAGHNAALIVRANGDVRELAATGLPLGLLPVGDYAAEELTLEPGDGLLIYTDGITEATNPAGEEYGLERLSRFLSARRKDHAEDLIDALELELEGFASGVPYGDDRTLLVLRRLPER
jgi:sigma-B regulation protein RsbU (phosphoserine phosphatase)